MKLLLPVFMDIIYVINVIKSVMFVLLIVDPLSNLCKLTAGQKTQVLWILNQESQSPRTATSAPQPYLSPHAQHVTSAIAKNAPKAMDPSVNQSERPPQSPILFQSPLQVQTQLRTQAN